MALLDFILAGEGDLLDQLSESAQKLPGFSGSEECIEFSSLEDDTHGEPIRFKLQLWKPDFDNFDSHFRNKLGIVFIAGNLANPSNHQDADVWLSRVSKLVPPASQCLPARFLFSTSKSSEAQRKAELLCQAHQQAHQAIPLYGSLDSFESFLAAIKQHAFDFYSMKDPDAGFYECQPSRPNVFLRQNDTSVCLSVMWGPPCILNSLVLTLKSKTRHAGERALPMPWTSPMEIPLESLDVGKYEVSVTAANRNGRVKSEICVFHIGQEQEGLVRQKDQEIIVLNQKIQLLEREKEELRRKANAKISDLEQEKTELGKQNALYQKIQREKDELCKQKDAEIDGLKLEYADLQGQFRIARVQLESKSKTESSLQDEYTKKLAILNESNQKLQSNRQSEQETYAATLRAKDDELASKDKEIAALKKQLADAQNSQPTHPSSSQVTSNPFHASGQLDEDYPPHVKSFHDDFEVVPHNDNRNTSSSSGPQHRIGGMTREQLEVFINAVIDKRSSAGSQSEKETEKEKAEIRNEEREPRQSELSQVSSPLSAERSRLPSSSSKGSSQDLSGKPLKYQFEVLSNGSKKILISTYYSGEKKDSYLLKISHADLQKSTGVVRYYQSLKLTLIFEANKFFPNKKISIFVEKVEGDYCVISMNKKDFDEYRVKEVV